MICSSPVCLFFVLLYKCAKTHRPASMLYIFGSMYIFVIYFVMKDCVIYHFMEMRFEPGLQAVFSRLCNGLLGPCILMFQ